MAEGFYNALLSIVDTAYVATLTVIDSLKVRSLSFYNWIPVAFAQLKELPAVYGPRFNELIESTPTYEELRVWVIAFPDVYGRPALAALKAFPESFKIFITTQGPLAITWIKTSPSVYGPIFLNWCQTTPIAVYDWGTTIAIPYIKQVSWLTWFFAFMTLTIDCIIILKAYYFKPLTVPNEFVEMFEANIHTKMNPFAFEPEKEGTNSHRKAESKCPFGMGNKDKDGKAVEMPKNHPAVPKPDEASVEESITKEHSA